LASVLAEICLRLASGCVFSSFPTVVSSSELTGSGGAFLPFSVAGFDVLSSSSPFGVNFPPLCFHISEGICSLTSVSELAIKFSAKAL